MRHCRQPPATIWHEYFLIDPTVTTPLATILLIENDFDNISIYTTILEYNGYGVVCAEDGVTGVELARSAHPDLIVMDISIPGIDGWEATRTIKADPRTASIPILVLTVHALDSDRQRAFEEGADGYMMKPAEPIQVVHEIRRMLSSGGGAPT